MNLLNKEAISLYCKAHFLVKITWKIWSKYYVFSTNQSACSVILLTSFAKVIGMSNNIQWRNIIAQTHKPPYFNYTLFLQATFFSTEPQCCLTFSWFELQMLLWCYLIHINIVIVCLCPFLGLGLFISFLYDVFFNFRLVFIVINHVTKFKQRYLFFVHFVEYLQLFLDGNMHEKCE